jgi:exopolysaccharide biosynthesis operon protein EpsL
LSTSDERWARRAPALGLSAALCLTASPALALYSDKLFLRANASINYDSNVFKLANELTLPAIVGGPQKSDTYYSLGAGLRLDLPVSRQRFKADLSATEFKYQRFDQLDYTGYNARGTWDWRVGNDWYGQFGAGYRQSQQTLSTQIGFFIPAVVRTYDGLANARYALTPQWELQAGASATSYRYVDEARRFGDFDLRVLDAGARYTSNRGNSTGARLRYERGDWPNRLPTASFGQQFDQYTVSLTADWRLAGSTRLYGDVGYTVHQRDSVANVDFSGPSGRLTHEWTPTGKLLLRTVLYQTRGPFESTFANYVRQTGIEFLPTYQATGKLTIQGSLTYRQLDFLGEAISISTEQRRDKLTSAGINAAYQVTRTVAVTASVNYLQRDSNVPFGDFKATVASLTAGLEF